MKIFVGMPLNLNEQAWLSDAVKPDQAIIGSAIENVRARKDLFDQCEVCLGRVPLDWLTAEGLRWMQLDSVGFDDLAGLDWSKLGQRLTVTNLHGFFAEPVAETMLAGVLGLYRGIPQLVEHRPGRRWAKMEIRPILGLLRGARVLLAGYGSIARRFEQVLAPFGCEVKALSRSSRHADALDLGSFDRELGSVDIVACTMPETAETRGFFDASRLDRFKRGAIFVNVGRGGVVDEQALVKVLRSGHLRGAVIDVTVAEPLPESHPLWDCPNAIITQHTAGGSEDENQRKLDAFIDNLRRYRAGQPLAGVVDWDKGY